MFKPFVPAKTLKACALIGLHLMPAESASVSSGRESLDVGDAWRCGCPKSPDWESDVESWTESEGTFFSPVQCGHNVEKPCSECVGALLVRRKDCLSSWKIGNLRGSL